jgi:hypothetical protein
MSIGSVLELLLLGIGSLAVLATIIGFLKNVRGGHKGKYQTSWFEEH